MQIKNSFDPETKRKILKSLGLSLISAGGAFFGALGTGQSIKASAVIALATGGGFLFNIIREYVKGEDIPVIGQPRS